MTEMSDKEIELCYGKERQWGYFDELKKCVHHGGIALTIMSFIIYVNVFY